MTPLGGNLSSIDDWAKTENFGVNDLGVNDLGRNPRDGLASRPRLDYFNGQ